MTLRTTRPSSNKTNKDDDGKTDDLIDIFAQICTAVPDMTGYTCINDNGTEWLNYCDSGEAVLEKLKNCSAYIMTCGDTVYDNNKYTDCLCNQDSDCSGFIGISPEDNKYSFCDPDSKLCRWDCASGYHIETNNNDQICVENLMRPEDLENFCTGKDDYYSECVKTSGGMYTITCLDGDFYDDLLQNCSAEGLQCGPVEYANGIFYECIQ